MRKRAMTQGLELFGDTHSHRRLQERGEFRGVPAYLLDISETIPQLGYGSHQFFRYYGKFPSVLATEIIRRFGETGGLIGDCYAGSGTTLVEAQIAGHESFGIDINPLAVLASEVKTRYYDYRALREGFEEVVRKAQEASGPRIPVSLGSKQEKWFTHEAANDLGRLRSGIETLGPGPIRDFLTIAFLAIVRRCSNAYDGEVRPHVNPQKRPRPPLTAFADKVEDMLSGLRELDSMRPPHVPSEAFIGDSRDRGSYGELRGRRAQLIVAHPPYLNSFNYLQVFSLEFAWASDLPEVWKGWSQAEIRRLEHRAWPATNVSLKDRYYEDLSAVARAATGALAERGVLAVVIGDATIRKVLEPVHQEAWERLNALDLHPVEIWFRTTHYGIGKYAYSHRADYHGDAEKRDAVMFFQQRPGRPEVAPRCGAQYESRIDARYVVGKH